MNYEFGSKRSYMTVGGGWSQDCYYGTFMVKCEDMMDGYWAFDSKHSYEVIHCQSVSDCYFSEYCSDSARCYSSTNLRGCTDCIACVGLENQSYHIGNSPVSKEVFEQEKKDYTKNHQKYETIREILKKEYGDGRPHNRMVEDCL